jgi:two-component system chemotaxis response regulator CheB
MRGVTDTLASEQPGGTAETDQTTSGRPDPSPQPQQHDPHEPGDEPLLDDRRVPAYPTPEDAVRALAAATRYARWRRRDPGARVAPAGVTRERAHALVERLTPADPEGLWLSQQDAVDQLMLEAMGVGALEVFVKPTNGFDARAAAELANVLRSAAGARLPERKAAPVPVYRPGELERRLGSASVIGIVASTGGPPALRDLLAALPPKFSVPIAIVQHTAVGFTQALANWLRESTGRRVEVGQAGRELRGVVIAPDDHHMEVRPNREIVLHRGPPLRGHRPSGTVLFQSLAAHGRGAVGIVCTGMNDDGATGLAAIEAAGGIAIVEDPQTAIIDSMPRAAIAACRSAVIASTPRIAALLQKAGSKS